MKTASVTESEKDRSFRSKMQFRKLFTECIADLGVELGSREEHVDHGPMISTLALITRDGTKVTVTVEES